MRKTSRMSKIAGMAIVASVMVAFVTVAFGVNTKNHMKSLHKTGAGLKTWYDDAGGLKSVTGVEYDTLDCKNCHTDNCKKCHVKSMKAVDTRDENTCLGCHQSITATRKTGADAGVADVHDGKKICNDCHIGKDFDDVHGNGEFKSKSDKGAVQAYCTNCHEEKQEIKSHKVHKGKVACAACHVRASISYVNGDFDAYAKSGYEGVFTPKMDWLMLINADDKVTTARVKTINVKSSGKVFISVEPYFTHSVQKKAKNCSECHGNAAMLMVKDGKKIPVQSASGVIPFAPDSLDWGVEGAVVQVIGNGKPLDDKQMTKLKMPIKDQ